MSGKHLSFEECDKLLCAPGNRYEMDTIVINGLPKLVWKHQAPHFRAYLVQQFTRFAERGLLSSPLPEPAPVTAREDLTYGEVFQRALKIAAWMREEHNIRVGSRVVVGGGNSTGWVVCWVAVHLLGAVPVLLNSTLQDEMQLHCIGLTGAELVLVDVELATTFGPVRKQLNDLKIGPVYCWSSVQHLPQRVRAGVHEIGNPNPSAGAILDVENGKGTESLNPESDGMILYTSGTTSHPKAVLTSQRAALSHTISSHMAGARAALRDGADLKTALSRHEPSAVQNVLLVPVPLFHVTGCMSWMVKAITGGGKLVFMRRWDVDEAIRIMVEEGVNIIGGVPAIATSLLQSPNFPKVYKMAGVNYGGAPPPARLAVDIAARWPGASITNGYGMTEMSGGITSISGQDYVENPTSVGTPVPLTEIRIVDPETEQDVPRGEMGLILARGSNCMTCYVGDAAATAKAIDKDGWFDTGDLASMNENGWITIRDRAKDMIIRGGENIASGEVEHAMVLDERVEHAAAVPVPDEVLGERVGVAVTLAPGAKATPHSIIQAANPRLRRPARPVCVVILDELPRNANGKVLKNELRKIVGEAWAKQGGMAGVKAKL